MTAVLLHHTRDFSGEPQVRVVAVSANPAELEQLVLDAENEDIELPGELELKWVDYDLPAGMGAGRGTGAHTITRCYPEWYSDGFFWEIQSI